MIKRLIIPLGGLVAILTVTALPVAASTTASPVVSNGKWNGYVQIQQANGQPVFQDSLVLASWTVPRNDCTKVHSAFLPVTDNIWVGLGGLDITMPKVSSTPLVQVGTSSKCIVITNRRKAPKYRQKNWAVYEAVTSPFSKANKLSYPVDPGDSIVSYVEYQGNGTYNLQIRDNSHSHANWSWLNQITVSDTRLPFTAEWIVESGQILQSPIHLPMADFGTVKFTGMYYETTTNGVITGHDMTDADGFRLQAGSPAETSVNPISSDSSGLITWSHR